MTKQEIEEKQAEENKVYEVAKQVAALLETLDDEQREKCLELITEDA